MYAPDYFLVFQRYIAFHFYDLPFCTVCAVIELELMDSASNGACNRCGSGPHRFLHATERRDDDLIPNDRRQPSTKSETYQPAQMAAQLGNSYL